jgi:hypothetical protein
MKNFVVLYFWSIPNLHHPKPVKPAIKKTSKHLFVDSTNIKPSFLKVKFLRYQSPLHVVRKGRAYSEQVNSKKVVQTLSFH